jgi:hypothetical protein
VKLRTLTTTLLLITAFSSLAHSKPWERISKAERALSSVAWYPHASAVVLLHRTNIILNDSGGPSRREEFVRLKILSEEGRDYGTVSLQSSEYARLKNLDARVVLPDKREIPLPKDAVFKKEYSTYYDTQVTSVVMPGIGVGAIVEWKYTIFFDNPLVTWEIQFESDLPTLRVCEIISDTSYFQRGLMT